MSNYTYYEPDYTLLNRKARSLDMNGNRPSGDIFGRLFSRWNNHGAITDNPKLFEQLAAVISAIKQQVDWEQNLLNASYVVFDTETTGLQPFNGDEIISLGAVIVENGKTLDEPLFHQLVNPKRPVSATAQRITGITDNMLQGKPEIGSVLLDFLRFAGPRILVAHNAPFDLAFINKKIGEAIGSRVANPVIDTVLLTSALFYSYGDYSLENLASRLNFSLEGRHDALSDARIAASLYIKLLPELQKRGIFTLPHLEKFFGEANPANGYPLIY